MCPSTIVRLGEGMSTSSKEFKDSGGGEVVGYITEFLMKDVSVKRKGSSLRVGHGVDRRVCEELPLIF